MDHRVKPGDDELVASHEFSFPRFKKPECETLHRAFLICANGLKAKRAPKRAAGTPGEFRLPRPPVQRKKAQTRVVTAKAESSPGVPHSALGPWAIRAITHDGLTACFTRPPEDGPSYPPLAGLLDFAVLALARVPDEAAKKGPVASGRLAGTVRLQPLRARVRYARSPQPVPDPHIEHAARHGPYLWIETRRNIVPILYFPYPRGTV
jgi:hypothetical protein